MRNALFTLLVLVPLLAFAEQAPPAAEPQAPRAEPAETMQEPDPAAVAAANEIIRITRAGDTLERMAGRIVAEMAPAFERANPGQGTLVREILESAFLDVFGGHQDRFIESMIPLYTGNFSREELEGLVAFYRSPLGQKLIEVQPVVSEQAMRMGGMWGQKLGELATIRAIQRMQAEGLETQI